MVYGLGLIWVQLDMKGLQSVLYVGIWILFIIVVQVFANEFNDLIMPLTG